MAGNRRIKVLLADDHLIVRMGLSALLGLEKDIEMVGEAANGEEAVRLTLAKKPDVVILDLMMPNGNGVEATREILRYRPETRVLILTTFSDSSELQEAMSAGALSALVKDTSRPDLVSAIRKTADGKRVIGRELFKILETDPTVARPHLSPRQLDIMHYVARGFNNAEIATALGVGRDCVKANLKIVFARLGAASRSEAVAIAILMHLLTV